MTRVFNGIAKVISATLGGTITVTPEGGPSRNIQAIFRAEDQAILHEGGVETISFVPTLAVHRPEVADLAPGGVVVPGNGKTYLCLEPMDAGSPDPNGFVVIQMEEQ